MTAATGPGKSSQALLRKLLPSVHKQLADRPKLAGVGVAANVLDAVTWGA